MELFAGAGGLNTELESPGFNVIFANEIVPIYAKSIAHNHPKTEICVDDIVCCGRANIDHLCRLNFDQGLLLT